MPVGVFRAVEKPTYEAALENQVEGARAQRGEGDLAALLNSGDTWTVEA
jgi:2-oxoglutarate ferredoxin oxidoreductase subunit beta